MRSSSSSSSSRANDTFNFFKRARENLRWWQKNRRGSERRPRREKRRKKERAVYILSRCLVTSRYGNTPGHNDPDNRITYSLERGGVVAAITTRRHTYLYMYNTRRKRDSEEEKNVHPLARIRKTFCARARIELGIYELLYNYRLSLCRESFLMDATFFHPSSRARARFR